MFFLMDLLTFSNNKFKNVFACPKLTNNFNDCISDLKLFIKSRPVLLQSSLRHQSFFMLGFPEQWYQGHYWKVLFFSLFHPVLRLARRGRHQSWTDFKACITYGFSYYCNQPLHPICSSSYRAASLGSTPLLTPSPFLNLSNSKVSLKQPQS